MARIIYLLPGQGGQLDKGLGSGLRKREFEVIGRETVTDFQGLQFSEKLELIREDLLAKVWSDEGIVVAHSFGAYLFLHAQSELPPFPGKVLLLSPIVGGFVNENAGIIFSLARPNRLIKQAEMGGFPSPPRCEIHVGSIDWQSDPHTVQRFGDLTNIKVILAPNKGHALGKDYVSPLLDKFFPCEICRERDLPC